MGKWRGLYWENECDLPAMFQTNFLVQYEQTLPVSDQIFVYVGPKVGLKQVNRIYPLQTSKFSHRRPQKLF